MSLKTRMQTWLRHTERRGPGPRRQPLVLELLEARDLFATGLTALDLASLNLKFTSTDVSRTSTPTITVHYTGLGAPPGVVDIDADLNHDGEVPAAEWREFVAGLSADDDGVLAKTALPFLQGLEGIGRRAPRMFDVDKDGDLTRRDLDELFERLDVSGDGALQRPEIGTHPIVGELAPDFELPLLSDTKTRVRLSSFRGKQPVGLIFGSYT